MCLDARIWCNMKRSGSPSEEDESSDEVTINVPAKSRRNSNLVPLFECPVCFDTVMPPILQCHSGHLVCSNCRPQLVTCPTCRGPLATIRNLAMEKVANKVMFPCKFRESGCTADLEYTMKKHHEEICVFRPFLCPCSGSTCTWQGNLNKVYNHLLSHEMIKTLNGEDIVFLATDLSKARSIDWAMIQSCFDHHFLLRLNRCERGNGANAEFSATVQLLGPKDQTGMFKCRLELCKGKRRLLWEAEPNSLQDDLEDVSDYNHFVFNENIAKKFSENGNLPINVTITKA